MDWEDIKDKVSDMPGCMTVPVVLSFVFIPMLLFDIVQRSDNSRVSESAKMEMYERYEEKFDSLNELIDSLKGEVIVYDDALFSAKRKLDEISDAVTLAQGSLSDRQLNDVEDYLEQIESECDYSDIER